MQLFNRTASVSVGQDGKEGLLVEKLRIDFEVVKTETSESNRATIKVSNLTEETRNKIRADQDQNAILKAGYTDATGEEVIFIGRISNVTHNTVPPNFLTEITCEDGMRVFREKRVSLSFSAGSTIKQAIAKVIEALAIPEKRPLALVPFEDKPFNNGYAFEGYAKEAMDELASSAGVDWSVQNGEIKIVPRERTDGSVAIRLTPETGLLGSPRRIKEQDKESTKKDETFNGWEIDALLQPRAEPGGVIELETEVVSPATQFKIVEVSHRGDTHGQTWKSNIRLKDIS